jgi:hypothetical protein
VGNLLYTNLAGVAPTAAQQAVFVGLIDQGVVSQTLLGQIVAETGLNAMRIDLVGLSNTGIEYIG